MFPKDRIRAWHKEPTIKQTSPNIFGKGLLGARSKPKTGRLDQNGPSGSSDAATARSTDRPSIREKTSNQRKPHPIAKVIAFAALAFLLFAYLNLAFIYKGNEQNKGTFDAFADMPHDSIDVAYFGTSATSRYFVNPKAFNDYGIASFTFGVNNCPSYFFKSLIEEMRSTQNPRLYIIELRSFKKNPWEISDGNVRLTFDTFPLTSPRRFEMAQLAAHYSSESESAVMDFLVPIVKYHSRLTEEDMTAEDWLLETPYNETQGFYCSPFTLTQAPQDVPSFTRKTARVDGESAAILEDLLDYCSTLDADVLFVLSPTIYQEFKNAQLNMLESICKRHGFPVLNCNTQAIFDEMGLNCKTDFYNDRHTNYLGAERFTDYLSKYLKMHYDLPDRRGDPTYQAWVDGYEKYLKFTSKGILHYDDADDEDDDDD